jgi:hydroxymethylglutaryl-CoA lyase
LALKVIDIVEVGLRDGLQRETKHITTADKIRMIDGLVAAGLKQIQVTSFVHPKLVPQMADAEAVCAGMKRQPNVRYSALVLNAKGVERAHAAGITDIDMSISASDAHGRQNAGMGLQEAVTHFAEMVALARGYGMRVRGGIQCAFGYYTNDVTRDLVVDLARQHLALGIDSLALADSTGMANPSQIRAMLAAVLPLTGALPLVLHLHDTRGMGLANVLAAVEAGCTTFDTAFGGIGGCNFIEQAAGNVPTEDTVNMLHAMGYTTGVDVAKVAQVSHLLADILARVLPGKVYQLINKV